MQARFLSVAFLFSATVVRPNPEILSLTKDDKISTTETSSGYGYQSIADLATSNHVPLGIVLDPSKKAMCSIYVTIKSGTRSLGTFISELKDQLPTHDVELRNGVLTISPEPVTKQTQNLLDLRIPEFRSMETTHRVDGQFLWIFARNVLVPNQGTAFHSSISTQSETITSIRSDRQSLEDNLYLLATRGKGAAWVLGTVTSERIEQITTAPYEIYDYAGESKALLEALACPT